MKKKNQTQRGNILLLIIPIVAVLLLITMGVIWWTSMNHKQTPKASETSVSADDSLTNGNANANLAQDVRILEAGTTRDKGFVSSTNTALSDESQPVLND
jgi:flagellar basal body-associated protein FliL